MSLSESLLGHPGEAQHSSCMTVFNRITTIGEPFLVLKYPGHHGIMEELNAVRRRQFKLLSKGLKRQKAQREIVERTAAVNVQVVQDRRLPRCAYMDYGQCLF